MSNQAENIIRRANSEKPEKYNILTFPTHERYESQLAKTGHNFYIFNAEGMKKWNDAFAPIPDNYHMFPENTIYQGINFDFILSQSKFGQFQLASQMNNQLRLPIVSLEHTLPIPQLYSPEQLASMRSMSGNINVFISDFSKDAWAVPGVCEVIHHSIDSELFKPMNLDRKPQVLSVANDFVNRDYCLNYYGWQRVTEGLTTRLVGDTEGLSKPAESTEKLVEEYNESQIFFNSSTLSPVPTSLLEAMSCGCAVVSTATCMIPEVIKNGVNGFISNDEGELRGYIEQLLNDEDLRKKLGDSARQTVINDFSEKRFINEWNNIFDSAYEELN